MTRFPRAILDEVGSFHAKRMAAASNSTDERLERIPARGVPRTGTVADHGEPPLSRNSERRPDPDPIAECLPCPSASWQQA